MDPKNEETKTEEVKTDAVKPEDTNKDKCVCEDGEPCENCEECEECECGEYEEVLNDLNTQLESEKTARLSLLADFTNFRKRAEKDREEAQITANKEMLNHVIEIVDDFDRAVHVEADKIDVNNDFYKGVMLIHKKLTDLLSSYGLSAIEAKVGDELDPITMQAIATAPVSDKKQVNKVIHLAGKGYVNKQTGRVFKTAKVIIGKASI